MKEKIVEKGVAILALTALIPAAAWAFGGDQSGGRRQGPPPEAIEACKEKSAGDSVEFTNRRGETLKAICREINGELMAVPEGDFGKGRRSGSPEGQ